VRRLSTIAASAALLLLLFAPAAFAAEPATVTSDLIIATNGTLEVPAGQQVDTVIALDSNSTIAGDVDLLIVGGGRATVTGATVESIFVTGGTVDLQAGTTVTGDVRTLDGTVTQQAGATVEGSIQSLDDDLAAMAILLIPVFMVLFLGFGVAAIVAGLLVAAFGARQVREVEALIEQKPGHALVAGIAGSILLPLAAILLMVTIVGAPVGFGLLFIVLPALAFLGWIVAAIWLGDWLVGRMRGSREPERPYLAAVLGIIVLAIAGLLPFVTTIATLFGFGGLLLAAWRVLRPEAPPAAPVGLPQPMPSAG